MTSLLCLVSSVWRNRTVPVKSLVYKRVRLIFLCSFAWRMKRFCTSCLDPFNEYIIDARVKIFVSVLWEHFCVKSVSSLAAVWMTPNIVLKLSGETGVPRATSGPRAPVTKPAELFVNLLLCYYMLIYFIFSENSENLWLLSRGLLYVDYKCHSISKTIPQNESSPNKNCITYMLFQEKF
jgi:hypothetical protein